MPFLWEDAKRCTSQKGWGAPKSLRTTDLHYLPLSYVKVYEQTDTGLNLKQHLTIQCRLVFTS